MIDLYNVGTNQLIGNITDADLKVLIDALEEEGVNDQDYYVDAATIDVIADGKATEHLVGLLRKALGAAEGVDIRWQRRCRVCPTRLPIPASAASPRAARRAVRSLRSSPLPCRCR